jgi:FecR protein
MKLLPTLAVIAACAAAALAATSAGAQQVGTATAVNPLSESTPPGAGTVTLTVGARIVHRERIHTTPTGSAQLLFLDKSTLSIAPNTSILIDEYVYDPNSGHGHMLAHLTEGALRFVGGTLSHQGEAELATPAAAVGIRGGTLTLHHDRHGTRIINHFGTITIRNGAGTMIINRPDFEVVVLDWNTPPGQPFRVTAEETAHDLQILTSLPWQDGGVRGLRTVTIGDCAGGAKRKDCSPQTWMNTDAGESDAFQIILQATQQATGRNETVTRRRGR